MEQRAIRYRFTLCKKSKHSDRTWKHEIAIVRINIITSEIMQRVSFKKIPNRDRMVDYLEGLACCKKQINSIERFAKLRQKHLSVVVLDDGTELFI